VQATPAASTLAAPTGIWYNCAVGANLTVETCTDVQGFLSLQQEWASLLRHSDIDTIFLTWQWQRAWWECFGQATQLSIVTIRDQGTLVGLAPFYSSPSSDGAKTLRLIGGVEVSDYLDIITAAGRAQVVYSALWQFLMHEQGHAWDVIDLHNVPEKSPTLAVLPALASGEQGVRLAVEVEDVCPIIDLPPSWEAYLAALDRKQRHEVRRKVRKAEAEGTVAWYYVDDETALPGEMKDFIALHIKSSRDKGVFMDESMQSFFQAIASAAFRRGWLRLAFLLINGVKTAAMLCFDYNDSFLLYNSGYDPELFGSLSPGVVLLAYSIRDAIDRGLRVFDFLQGAEEYKYRLGGQDTRVCRLMISR
jgi:CelD/BcsL family acetyltransferase involved in cellulose biosynthesis